MWQKIYGVVGAYKRLFSTIDGKTVLKELADFTGFYEITDTDATPQEMARQEGRREVFDHIIRYCNLPPEQVAELHKMTLDNDE